MNCPRCGSPSRVKSTTVLCSGVRRRRVCTTCPHRFNTSETDDDSAVALAAMVRKRCDALGEAVEDLRAVPGISTGQKPFAR